MQDIFGSVRRSLVFRQNPHADESGAVGGGIAERIGSCLRKSKVGLGGIGMGLLSRIQSLAPLPEPPAVDTASSAQDCVPAIRWRKGELIGCGAFGHVYMGMNLDSGELLAVKQVMIGTSSAFKEKAQDNIRELEEEVKLLKKLSHPNIVRYLGTAREEDTLNILLEFVPGGSISSLLGKFGSFPEAVIRTYTKQLLQGLGYLHQNGIIHRDIKGANILVDNKGCIKLADFGASKRVAKLATLNAAKSMKGTPYWMAPEVIVQTGHSFSADIWSVGCTVIEMATGKPPWSQQYQEVAVLYHIGTTKSHPPIPENLSPEAKDFLLRCLQKEPNMRSTASELLQHPFVTGECQDARLSSCSSDTNVDEFGSEIFSALSPEKLISARPIWEMDDSDQMCQLDDQDDFSTIGKSFNPMSEPFEDCWHCEVDATQEQRRVVSEEHNCGSGERENHGIFPCESICEDDDEVTETKIRVFLDEKARDLKKLQTPLYEEFYNTINASKLQHIASNIPEESKSSPRRARPELSTPQVDAPASVSPGRHASSGNSGDRVLREIPSPQLNESEGTPDIAKQHPSDLSFNFCERRRKWKEELDQELASQREMMRLGGVGGRISSPKDKCLSKKLGWSRIIS
ncbi:unnamed protein product [Spirodela intermedia]|uniref:mitogen-activated protein kinase kinase kinase n=1 Tax=Spirodela intermedia TaxID=51605 RepID=A0A7I8LAP4_SPIIN|nr:unnamed protein product [Spirodela intermedia]